MLGFAETLRHTEREGNLGLIGGDEGIRTLDLLSVNQLTPLFHIVSPEFRVFHKQLLSLASVGVLLYYSVSGDTSKVRVKWNQYGTKMKLVPEKRGEDANGKVDR